ncbi:putative ribonuclease H-like domain-containing protein, partial [Tanacetum coccineum]
ALIIKDWVSDSKEEDVPQAKIEKKTVKPSFTKIEFVKPKGKTAKRLKIVVNAARPKAVVNVVKGNNVNDVKASTYLQKKGVIDSVCSRHMTENMSYLTDFKEINRGYVAFGDNPKGGKITSKGIIKTGTLDFENVYFLSDESHVLLKVPRKNNMYSVDLKNIVLKGGLTYLFVKATSDESKLWHRRLGHINFKTMNKLVKGNLIRDYILLPLWTVDPSFSQSSKSSPDDGSKPSSDDEKKVDEDPRKDSESIDQENDDNVSSTNNVNDASTNKVNDVGGKTSIELPDDPNMSALEDIVYSNDDEDVGAEADMNNLEITIQVSPNPTTRIHKDHPLDQVIGDLQLTTLTRKMTKNLEEYRFVSTTLKQRTNHKDFQNCMFACFLSQEEPKKMDVKSAFLYGKIEEEVYICQPPGFEDPDFSDRVYKVEKELYRLHQAPRAWYETLSTYLLDNGFQRGKIDKTLFIRRDKGDIMLVQVYVDDIIFGSTKKELCNAFEKLMHEKFQMSSIGKLTFVLGLQVKQKNNGDIY